MRKAWYWCVLLLTGYCQAAVLVVTEITPPMQIMRNGQLEGKAVDKVREVFALARLELDIQAYPWARSYNMVRKVPDTLIFPLARTPEREHLFVWLGVISNTRYGFVRLKSRADISVNDFISAKAYKTAVARDDATHQLLRNKGFVDGKHLILGANLDDNIDLLYKRRVDFIIGSPHIVSYIAKTLGYDDDDVELAIWLDDTPRPLYLAANRQTSPVLLNKLKRAFVSVEAVKLYQKPR